MVHTLPDYTSKWKNKTISSLVDNGELAARLGNIDTFDRRGNVIWMDDFEDNINKWAQTTLGTGAAVSLSTVKAHTGGSSCKLTTGDNTANSTFIYKQLAYPATGKMGLELAVQHHESIKYIDIVLHFYTGTRCYSAQLRYDVDDEDLEFRNLAGAFINLNATTVPQSEETLFNVYKIVCDSALNKWVRIIVNDTEYDVSEYFMWDAADATAPYLLVSIAITPDINDNLDCYVDNVIVTQNEP